ncbi:uncharacterized protein MYCFIDRAFT_186431 [Pseudocercospora fijiensis CIRAD86]|uniref:Major facilitator superfamily (MFS) profile domain-containing protein n=1 Tax=Pseudocercospora fijiensis (strain CIRAD86) TaxID=383855 RepID=M2Z8E9_PSEFD|nr:uncharacterized protein MYCFIDRAFT_186431 [Pseudocercospora fijiensis CIRAD86]EME86060.1 hypothetical protein MYCFIDRAFT_186431 [Pseudocercospora fijiensis CIRAD86]
MARESSGSSTSSLRQEWLGVSRSHESDLEKDVPMQSQPDNASQADARTSKPEPASPVGRYSDSPIPDGGLRAWLQGIVTAYGVFQSYYRSSPLRSESNSSISWIGTIQGFLLAFMTIFAGPIFDRGHPHVLVATGGFLVVFGTMMTSLCKQNWQFFLAQGVCVGLGAIVAVAILSGWFEGRRAIATGIAACGAAIGGVIYPIVFHRLQPVIGFPWAVRVMAFIMLATTLVSLAIVKMRTKPPPRPKIVDFTAFRELLFTLFAIICFVGSMGLYVPFFYITDYAAEVEGLNHELAFYMLPILASGGILGRIIPAVLADRIGTLQVLALTTSVAAALPFFWILVRSSTGGIVVWSLFYGIFSGPFVSLRAPTIAAITPDMRIVGGRLGMSTF